jgi:hypothetical protein
MPPVSQQQRKAMYAAAAGKSNIGIPQKVGKEFTAADKPGKLPTRVKGGKAVKGYALGGYVKGGDQREQSDRPRGGPALMTRSRFIKESDTFRTSLQEQDYDKGKVTHERPKGEGKVEEVED